MPYRYRDDIATADIAFEAWGATVEETFVSASEAVIGVMLENPESIAAAVHRTLTAEADSMEMLLFRLLDELIYYKDAECLFLLVSHATIGKQNGLFSCIADVFGEKIDPEKHELVVDVKAVTLYRFRLEKTTGGWTATVVLDI